MIYLYLFDSVLWNPSSDGSQVVSVCEQHLELWDLDRTASTAEVSNQFKNMLRMCTTLQAGNSRNTIQGGENASMT